MLLRNDSVLPARYDCELCAISEIIRDPPKILLEPIDFVFQSLFFLPVNRFWGSPKKNTPLLLPLGIMREIVKDFDEFEVEKLEYLKNPRKIRILGI